jgi:hypothetical protein
MTTGFDFEKLEKDPKMWLRFNFCPSSLWLKCNKLSCDRPGESLISHGILKANSL